MKLADGLRVLYWDPSDVGHHHRYLQAIVDGAPDAVAMVLPEWFRDIGMYAQSASFIPQSQKREHSGLIATVRTTGASIVILGRGDALMRKVAVVPQRFPAGLIVIDLRSVPAMLRKRYRSRKLDIARGVTDLTLREIATRRGSVVYCNLVPEAVIGSTHLRARSCYFRDPLDIIPAYEACKASRGLRRIVLVGALFKRKGIVDLALAASRLPEQWRSQIEVVYAGEPSGHGAEQLRQADSILNQSGIATRTLSRHLQNDELSNLITTADVVALPYRHHHGGSGLLGTALACSTAQIVVPDFGLMGEIARDTEALSFRHLDIDSLSQTLRKALEAGSRTTFTSVETLEQHYGTERELSDVIWQAAKTIAPPNMPSTHQEN